MAMSTPRNVYPLLRRWPAASPATTMPSVYGRLSILGPASGIMCASYSTVFPPRMNRCTFGCSLSLSMKLKDRSEEHTSELQSHLNLVCRLLLEKKKNYCSTPYFRLHVRAQAYRNLREPMC